MTHLNTPNVRAYLRASTTGQDALRAKDRLTVFVESFGTRVTSYYSENITGTTANRPELDRLLTDSHEGDLIVVESLDRLTRLSYNDWKALQLRLITKGIVIVSYDLEMTHSALNSNIKDNDLMKALTSFMLDTVAIAARANYDDRRLKQAEGIAKAKVNGTKSGIPTGGVRVHDSAAIVSWKNSSGSSIAVTATHFNVSKSTVNRAMRKYK